MSFVSYIYHTISDITPAMCAIFADFVPNNHEVNMILYNSSVNKLILCYILNTIFHILPLQPQQNFCTSPSDTAVFSFWINWTNRVNQWFKGPFIKTGIYWIPEWINHLNESNEWMTQTHIYRHLLGDLVYLEYHFIKKYNKIQKH